MIRARISTDTPAEDTVALPSVVLVPRVTRSPRLGFDWILESTLRGWVEGALERGVRFADPRVLLDPASAAPSDGPRVVLVFDQLLDETYVRVLPWLHDLEVAFAVCVATATVGRSAGRRRSGPRVVAWRDLVSMAQAGVVVGTRGHFDLDLRSLPSEQVFHDLAVAQAEMERRLHTTPWLVRYPSPAVPARVAEIAARLGYRVGLCPVSGPRAVGDPLRWPAWHPRPWHGTGRLLEGKRALSAMASSTTSVRDGSDHPR